MKTYRVIIEETISKEFELDAENADCAVYKAIELYKDGEFVLDSENVTNRQIALIDDNEEIGDWIEI